MFTNHQALVEKGFQSGRELILDLMEHGIDAVHAGKSTSRTVKVNGPQLRINSLNFDLTKGVNDIYVIGAGKATFPIAEVLERRLGDRIRGGLISIKGREEAQLEHIEIFHGGHPVPNQASLDAGKKAMELANEAGKGDLVLCPITGGASALLTAPSSPISLKELQTVNQLLLNAGLSVDEINTVRKHISDLKGGRLAQAITPAQTVNLLIIDEVAGKPWGPTVPDGTSFRQAEKILRRHDLWESVPKSVKSLIRAGTSSPEMETPNRESLEALPIHNVILADNSQMCEAVVERSNQIGTPGHIISTKAEGESKEVGLAFGSIGTEIAENRRPFDPPFVLVMGGETTVHVTAEGGKGGPSQEFALSAARKISEINDIAIGSLDTDGTDGPTDLAGAVVDGETLNRVEEKGFDIPTTLNKNDSSPLLETLGDAFITGPTGTNVMDLNILYVGPR